MLCEPWTYGNAPLHIPNNTDYTVTPDNGKMKTAAGLHGHLELRSPDRPVPEGRGKAAGINTWVVGSWPRDQRERERERHAALLHLASFFPPWVDEEPFLVTGLALGGVYALSGVGLIVLFRTTGVLNLSFGAVGAFGALIAWQLINHSGVQPVVGLPGRASCSREW